MGTVEQSPEIAEFAKRIMENLNMVYELAADRNRIFAEADDRFEELYLLLKYYQCYDIAAEHAGNFAGIAYYRGEYLRAMELIADAVDICTAESGRAAYRQKLHDMAYRLLAVGLTESADKLLLERVELVLEPEDYRTALRTAAANLPGGANVDSYAAGFLRRLSLEVLRQAIRLESTDPCSSLILLRDVLPWLNEKRAAPVRLEIQRLESICHE
ncbi:MAG: hypothetical protein HUJ66_05960 [Oscillospiraceae bacterium]|nr:hypothetical protein [Oscillospiraceae bacterium]